MLHYLVGRIAQAALTLLLLAVLIFVLARVIGNPVNFMLPIDADPKDIERITKMLGFDRPLHVQFLEFIGGVLVGDFGISIRQQTPVIDLIGERFLNSMWLIVVAMAWATVASIALGIVAALHRGGVADAIARFVAVIGQSAPSFWVGIVLVQVFSVQLEWFPSAGIDSATHYVLPAFALGLLAVAGMTRLLRSSMLEVLDTDYVKKARIMGVSEWNVVMRHCLPNAILPVLTYAGEYFALLLTAGVVVEVVFAWPGMGRLAYEAVFTRDYPLIQGVVFCIAAFAMLMNILVDLLYAVIDPRIRYVRR